LRHLFSVYHEAAKGLNDETFYFPPGHQHNPGIIRNWAIIDDATASEQHSLLFRTSAEG
jgi:hypothetical protein